MKSMATPIFDHTFPKIIKTTFSFPGFAPARNLFIPSLPSWDAILESRKKTDHTHFLPYPPKNFDHLLVYVDLYQYAKNRAISLTCSGDMFD